MTNTRHRSLGPPSSEAVASRRSNAASTPLPALYSGAVAPSARSRSSVDVGSALKPFSQSPTDSMPVLPRVSTRLFVVLGPGAFRVCWLAILLFHTACLVFCVGTAWIYAKLPGTVLAYLITSKALAIDLRYFPLVSNVYAFIAAAHAFFIANMLAASIARRQLTFFWWPGGFVSHSHAQSRLRSITSIAPAIASMIEPATAALVSKPPGDGSGSTLARTPTTAARTNLERARAVLHTLFGRRGLFGVNGQHFEHILLLRELIEASLQTVQAYDLARLLPRLLLVRTYVILLVVNCWSTMLLHRLVPNDVPLQRMLCLVCDLVLDFASVIGIWSVLAYRYVMQYDPAQKTFPITLLTNDIWYINFLNDFRLVLISSWFDLGSQFAFFISIFSSINDVKLLLYRRANTSVDIHRRRNAVDPHHAIRNSTDATASMQLDAKIRSTANSERVGGALTRILHTVMALLGAVILTAHVYAEVRPEVPGCRLEVLSWFRSKSGCALLEIDCYHSKATGSQLEITTGIREVALDSLEHLALLHCPSLHVPPSIQELSQLRVLKIYNSTVEQWDEDAALVETYHPYLGSLIIARVNLTDQRLPEGLLSHKFPPLLTNVQLSVVNIAAFPPELASIWPKGMSLFWESSGLTSLPPTLVHMSIPFFSIAMNDLSELPPEFVYKPGLVVVNLGGNPISELAPRVAGSAGPDAVPFATTLTLDVRSTKVAILPDSMITALLASSSRRVLADSTPLCTSLTSSSTGIDKRLLELYARGSIYCTAGKARGSFPLESTTAKYAIHD